MKVLVVSFYYPPEMGAAPSRISNMAQGLRSKGVDVEVLTCLPNYPKGRIFDGYQGCLFRKEDVDGITVHRYWTYATVSKSPIARLMGMLVFSIAIWMFGLKWRKIRSYDKVIVQSPPLFVGFSAVLLFRCIYGRQTILNVSDLWPISAVELGAVKKGGANYRVLSWMERFVYKKSSAFQGQSQEIVDHIAAFGYDKPHFLYRNLQPQISVDSSALLLTERKPLRLVYAGLLGVAQDLLGIIEHIDFKDIGAELHIFGGGNQAEAIEDYVSKHDCGVFCHGYRTKDEINSLLPTFHASIVPLAVSIKGAVPSKIYDLLPHGTPILFCGGGEGERIVSEHGLGLVSQPGNYEVLKQNILQMKSLSDDEYLCLRNRCLQAAKQDFSFQEQMARYYRFLCEGNN